MPYSIWELYGIVTSASIFAFLQPEKPPNSLGKKRRYRNSEGIFLVADGCFQKWRYPKMDGL